MAQRHVLALVVFGFALLSGAVAQGLFLADGEASVLPMVAGALLFLLGIGSPDRRRAPLELRPRPHRRPRWRLKLVRHAPRS